MPNFQVLSIGCKLCLSGEAGGKKWSAGFLPVGGCNMCLVEFVIEPGELITSAGFSAALIAARALAVRHPVLPGIISQSVSFTKPDDHAHIVRSRSTLGGADRAFFSTDQPLIPLAADSEKTSSETSPLLGKRSRSFHGVPTPTEGPSRAWFLSVLGAVLAILIIYPTVGYLFSPCTHYNHHGRHGLSSKSHRHHKHLSHEKLKKILLETPSAQHAREWSRYYASGPHLAGKNFSQASPFPPSGFTSCLANLAIAGGLDERKVGELGRGRQHRRV